MVEPAEELELPVRPAARQVAGAVEALARTAEGVGHEALGGELRAAEIAPGEALAARYSSPGTPTGTSRSERSSTWRRLLASGRPMVGARSSAAHRGNGGDTSWPPSDRRG